MEIYYTNANANKAAIGIDVSSDEAMPIDRSAPDVKLVVLKTSSKPMLVVFAQLVSFTSGTSLGSAKVISAH